MNVYEALMRDGKERRERFEAAQSADEAAQLTPTAALPEPDCLLDGGRLRCYYSETVARVLASQRKPLTDEQIDALALDSDGLPNSHLELARAIEQAHGIGA